MIICSLFNMDQYVSMKFLLSNSIASKYSKLFSWKSSKFFSSFSSLSSFIIFLLLIKADFLLWSIIRVFDDCFFIFSSSFSSPFFSSFSFSFSSSEVYSLSSYKSSNSGLLLFSLIIFNLV